MAKFKILEKARAAGLEPEDYVELLVQANGGVSFRAALQLGVAPNAVQEWLRRGLEKRTRARINMLLGNGDPRWVIKSIQWSNKSPKAKPQAVVLVVQEKGRQWDDAGCLEIGGQTEDELYINIADMVERCDPEAWLESDGTIPMR